MNKIKKPEILFHGTSSKNLEVLEPKAITMRNKKDGPVVFGTHDEVFASIFMVQMNDSWTDSGHLNDIPYLLIADKQRFLGLDSGGAIYQMPSDTFVNPKFDKGEKEWASKVSVTPIGKTEYENALDTMIELGVQVYFVSLEKMNRFKKSKEATVINSFKSENQKRDKNVRKFE